MPMDMHYDHALPQAEAFLHLYNTTGWNDTA